MVKGAIKKQQTQSTAQGKCLVMAAIQTDGHIQHNGREIKQRKLCQRFNEGGPAVCTLKKARNDKLPGYHEKEWNSDPG